MKAARGIAKQRREFVKFWLEYRWPLIGAAVVLVLALVANFGFSQYDAWVSEKHQEQVKASALAITGAVSDGVDALVAGLDRELDLAGLAGTAKSAGREAILPELERVVAGRSDVLGIRFVDPGENAVDRESTPPLGYAALDMLEQSEKEGRPAPPEALFFGSPDQHIALLRRLADGDELLGHLLIALDVAVMQRILGEAATVSSAPALVQIQQPAPQGPALVLAKTGDPQLGQGLASLRQGMTGTRWRVAYWAPPQGAAISETVGLLIWGVLGLLGVLALGGGVVIALRQRKKPAPVYEGAVAKVIVEDEREDVLTGFDEAAPPPPAPDLASGLIVEEEDDSPGAAPADLAMPPPLPDDASSAEAPPGAAPPPQPPPVASGGAGGSSLPPESIFRAYDIRGVVGEQFGAEHVRALGRAIGSEAYDRGQQTIVVARDGRVSSPEFHEALIGGLRSSGRDVIDIGMVPTPVLYFATHYLNTGSGVMVTGSHNPPQYNGLKIMLGGDTLSGADVAALRTRLGGNDLQSGEGNLQEMDLLSEYIRRISEDIPVALGNAYRIVIDCGNGVAGSVAPKLFRALGHDVVELYCDIDGTFPNHQPDTSDPANLVDLAAAVVEHEADLGFGFDGDGDRLAVLDGRGEVIWPDRLMMLYARDILSRNPGAKVVFDVKCTNRLGVIISKLGGVPIMWKTGHSFMKNKLREEGAELAGELSGHIFFQERWYGFDDAMYAAARLLEILMAMKQSPTDVLSKLPTGVSTPELRVDVDEGVHLSLMGQIGSDVELPEGKISTIDGVRADFADGWGLVRASNTTPSLVFRFEANDEAALARIQGHFRGLVERVAPELELPF